LSCELAGCGLARQAEIRERNEAIRAASNDAVAVCNTKQFKLATARAQCLNDAERPLAQIAPDYADLFSVKLATRYALAEQIDRGQITQAQADLEMAKANANLVTSGKQRLNADRAVEAQEAAAAAASNSVTCNRWGNSVTCY
jgi:hypothetical protein